MSQQYSYGPGGAGGAGGYGGAPPQQQGYGGYGAPSGGGGGGYGSTPSGGYGGAQPGGYGGGPQQGGPPGAAGGGGGYPPQGSQRPQAYTKNSGPPPGSDPQLWNFFIAVDRDGSGHINANELQAALVNGDWTAFDLDTVKLLMSIFDVDRSGTVCYQEFAGLWKYIQDWQGVFRHFDGDRSGKIDQGELANALRSFGYNLSPHLLHLITAKYSGISNGRGPQGITFDRFVRACVVIKTLTESFQKFDTDRDGWATLSYDQFMGVCLAAP